MTLIQKTLLIAAVMVLLAACSEQPVAPIASEVPEIHSAAPSDRAWTVANCQDILNREIVLEGEVLFEDCGKNCLGGCPGSGPQICFYGVKDDNGCLVFVKSRTKAFAGSPETRCNTFEYQEHVRIKGYVSEFPHVPEPQIRHETSYFILSSDEAHSSHDGYSGLCS